MTNCGPGGNESCCTSLEVPGTDGGTTFYRTYTNDGTGPTGQADPATVSGFRLDKYLVTVGRFRQFAEIAAAPDGGAAWVPPVGSGKHAHLNGGQGLVDVSTHGPDGGTAFEPGWLASSDANVQPTTANLTSCSNFYTYTSAPGSQELLPINCVTSFEAYAFCIWDGGFLPSEAEWEFAAAGGTQQLEFPWGSTQPGTTCPGTGCEYLIYACDYPSGSGFCNQGQGNIAPVGTATLGAGLWGHLDMAGELWEWNIDWLSNTYVNPCNDCGYFNPSTTNLVVIRGGYFFNPTAQDNVPWLRGGRTYLRDDEIGFRCARTP
jgi:formylglycine-generating enzyme required for sulfatase activity